MRYGHFQFVVMPFDLTNAHFALISLMNKIFQLYLDRFVIMFIDDILVYSGSCDDNDQYLWIVLKTLREK